MPNPLAPAEVAQIRPARFDDWLSGLAESLADQRATVLDVREPWELQTAQIADDSRFDMLAIPMNQIVARVAELDPEKPLACLCHHGARSQRVAQWLAQQGFMHVVNITGGIDLWATERDAAVARY
jgi:rhodanese-related sulfurtransferase